MLQPSDYDVFLEPAAPVSPNKSTPMWPFRLLRQIRDEVLHMGTILAANC